MGRSRFNHSGNASTCRIGRAQTSDFIQIQRLVCIYDYLFRCSKPPFLTLYQFHKAEKFFIWGNFFALSILDKCWLVGQEIWADLIQLGSKIFINFKNEVVSEWFGNIVFRAGFCRRWKWICASLHPLVIDLCNLSASNHISPFDEVYIFL